MITWNNRPLGGPTKKYVVGGILSAIGNWFYRLWYHRRIIKHLEAESHKSFELRFKEMNARYNGIEFKMGSPIFKLFIESCAEWILSESKAKNYVTADAYYQGHLFEVAVRKRNGNAPGDIVSELRHEVGVLRSELEAKQLYETGVYPYLDISNKHLLPEDRRLLFKAAIGVIQFPTLVYANHGLNDSYWVFATNEQDSSISPELFAILAQANKQGCQWIRFSPDGQLLTTLKRF